MRMYTYPSVKQWLPSSDHPLLMPVTMKLSSLLTSWRFTVRWRAHALPSKKMLVALVKPRLPLSLPHTHCTSMPLNATACACAGCRVSACPLKALCVWEREKDRRTPVKLASSLWTSASGVISQAPEGRAIIFGCESIKIMLALSSASLFWWFFDCTLHRCQRASLHELSSLYVHTLSATHTYSRAILLVNFIRTFLYVWLKCINNEYLLYIERVRLKVFWI